MFFRFIYGGIYWCLRYAALIIYTVKKTALRSFKECFCLAYGKILRLLSVTLATINKIPYNSTRIKLWEKH
jgi:hypothetical protein